MMLTLEVSINIMSSSTSGISASLAKARRAQGRLQEAWATWRQSAGDAHFAAVMGFALPRNLHPGTEWNVQESLAADTDLQDQIAASTIDEGHAEALRGSIQGHIEWLLAEMEQGVISDAQSVLPGTTALTLADPNPAIEASKAAMKAVTKTISKLEARLVKAQAEVERFEQDAETRGLSLSRRRAIQLHTEQSDFVLHKAKELSFCDEALDEVYERMKGQPKSLPSPDPNSMPGQLARERAARQESILNIAEEFATRPRGGQLYHQLYCCLETDGSPLRFNDSPLPSPLLWKACEGPLDTPPRSASNNRSVNSKSS